MEEDRQQEKTEYEKIISGEAEPVGHQKGWRNLEKRQSFNRMDPEKLREISKKGAAASLKVRGEKKTAREALENILSLKATDKIINEADLSPEMAERLKRSGIEVTFYDLIQLVAVGRAVGGNIKAAEYVRDTFGDMPIKQVEITENITTDADRALLQGIAERLQNVEIVQTVEAVETGDDIKGKSADDPNTPS